MPRASVLICSDEDAAMPSMTMNPRDYSPDIKAPFHKPGTGCGALTPQGESNKKRREDDRARSCDQPSATRRAAAMACRRCGDRGDDSDADRLCLCARSAHRRGLLLDL